MPIWHSDVRRSFAIGVDIEDSIFADDTQFFLDDGGRAALLLLVGFYLVLENKTEDGPTSWGFNAKHAILPLQPTVCACGWWFDGIGYCVVGHSRLLIIVVAFRPIL